MVWVLQRQRCFKCEEASGAAPAVRAIEPLFEYRSRFVLLGLPLVHIRLRGGLNRGSVKAWFAAGDAAIGLIFACGGLAVAPVSFGGFAAGLVTLGGFGFGILVFGGFSLGVWAVGGVACGLQALGGCAIGWTAAQGAVSVARDVAIGVTAFAPHANDAFAETFMKDSEFFTKAMAFMRHAQWMNLIWLLPSVLWWWKSRSQGTKAPKGAPYR